MWDNNRDQILQPHRGGIEVQVNAAPMGLAGKFLMRVPKADALGY